MFPGMVTHICLDRGNSYYSLNEMSPIYPPRHPSLNTAAHRSSGLTICLSVCLSLSLSLSPNPPPCPCPKQRSQISSATPANCVLIHKVWSSLQPTVLELPSLPSQLFPSQMLLKGSPSSPLCLFYIFIYETRDPQRQPCVPR